MVPERPRVLWLSCGGMRFLEGGIPHAMWETGMLCRNLGAPLEAEFGEGGRDWRLLEGLGSINTSRGMVG